MSGIYDTALPKLDANIKLKDLTNSWITEELGKSSKKPKRFCKVLEKQDSTNGNILQAFTKIYSKIRKTKSELLWKGEYKSTSVSMKSRKAPGFDEMHHCCLFSIPPLNFIVFPVKLKKQRFLQYSN